MKNNSELNPNDDSDQSNLDEEKQELNSNPEIGKTDTAPKSLADIGATLTNSMPDVQQHAIDQELENQAESVSKFAHLTDKNGVSFDPNLHKVKKDGTPTVSKLGKLMLKPNAPKESSTKNTTKSSAQNVGQIDEQVELSPSEKQQCVALGKVSANMIFAVGRMVGGQEWQPVKQQGYDEAAAMEQAFADYYIVSGKTEMSPSAALGLAICSYALPRFTMPETKKKSASIGRKLHAWWHSRKGAKEEKARLNAEQVRRNSEKKDATFEA